MAKCSVEMYSNKKFSAENLLFTFDKCIVIKLMLMHSATYTLHKYTCTTLLLCAHTHTHTHPQLQTLGGCSPVSCSSRCPHKPSNIQVHLNLYSSVIYNMKFIILCWSWIVYNSVICCSWIVYNSVYLSNLLPHAAHALRVKCVVLR